MNVVELFAGVGGFRIGLDRVGDGFFKTIWSNQFEPATKRQHASETYIARFGEEGHVNKDVALVRTDEIPDCDIMCGGFPCQDYSVAHSGTADGIQGKKGILWWEITRIVREKSENKPQILFLENVDRLLSSPAKQRGRDFAIMLHSLYELGYAVEWRIINAADYGMPQRRRRVYILAYKEDSTIFNQIHEMGKWLTEDGVLANAFPCESKKNLSIYQLFINGDTLAETSEYFNKRNDWKPFENAGIMIDGYVYTVHADPVYNGQIVTLGDILACGDDRKYITDDFYLSEESLPKWKYLKGAKSENRKTKDGFEFKYTEGGMAFPDPLDKPSRTIITSEGGSAPSRFKHVIEDPVNHRLRRLIPLELERLDMFPDNHTIGQSDTKRAFFMGNALVCGVITKIGEELKKRLS